MSSLLLDKYSSFLYACLNENGFTICARFFEGGLVLIEG